MIGLVAALILLGIIVVFGVVLCLIILWGKPDIEPLESKPLHLEDPEDPTVKVYRDIDVPLGPKP